MGIAASLGLTATGPAVAAECSVKVFANLPVTMMGWRASVPVKINGKDTSFWLDSGAFFSIMSRAKAAEFGLKLQSPPAGFFLTGIGGNTVPEITIVRSFGIIGQEISNIEFLVGGSDAGNGLIGRNLLGVADTEFDLADGSVKLLKSQGCGTRALAYWAAGIPFFTVSLESSSNPHDHEFRLPVSINGVKIEAELDSGAPTSLISRRAAERAGVDLSGPGVTPLNNISGFGKHSERGWIVPVDNVSVGDEQILHTHLSAIDGAIADHAPDMLLGADFLLAHHIYVARDQRQIYFTYSGGKPFLTSSTRVVDTSPAAKTAAAPLPPGTHRVEVVQSDALIPKTAEEYARRGNARLTAGAFAGAISDFSQAIQLSPDTANYFRDRSKAYRESGKPAPARVDLAKALELAPHDGELLRMRAFARLGDHDLRGALTDAEAAASVTTPSSLEAAQVAFLFLRLAQPARAVLIYDSVIAAHREDSKLGQLLNGRCWSRALANIDLDKALNDCNRAIRQDGIKAGYLNSRGLVYFRMADYASAIADYNAALKLAPNLSWSLYVRGLAKTQRGDIEDGKADEAAAIAIQADIVSDAAGYGVGQ
jgi:tetratricopeptide (TPR) repeat protein